MNGKITRRQLAGVAAGSAVVALGVVKVIAQTPASPDFDKAARESHRENSGTLAKFEIPMSLEPAFQFKA
ncbi:MAG TPA: hypothetical protein VGL82_12755 [Bryobacteraceae bacterium]|jgi:hypothetical protein